MFGEWNEFSAGFNRSKKHYTRMLDTNLKWTAYYYLGRRFWNANDVLLICFDFPIYCQMQWMVLLLKSRPSASLFDHLPFPDSLHITHPSFIICHPQILLLLPTLSMSILCQTLVRLVLSKMNARPDSSKLPN